MGIFTSKVSSGNTYERLKQSVSDDDRKIIMGIKSRILEPVSESTQLTHEEIDTITRVKQMLRPVGDGADASIKMNTPFMAAYAMYAIFAHLEKITVEVDSGVGEIDINALAVLMHLSKYGLRRIVIKDKYNDVELFKRLIAVYVGTPVDLDNTLFAAILSKFCWRLNTEEIGEWTVHYNYNGEQNIWLWFKPNYNSAKMTFDERSAFMIPDRLKFDEPPQKYEAIVKPGGEKESPSKVDQGGLYRNRFSVNDIDIGVVEVGLNIKQWLMARLYPTDPIGNPNKRDSIRLLGATFLANGGNGMVFRHDRDTLAFKILGHFSLVKSKNYPTLDTLTYTVSSDIAYSEQALLKEERIRDRMRHTIGWEYDSDMLDELHLWNWMSKEDVEKKYVIQLVKLYVFRTQKDTADAFVNRMAVPSFPIGSTVAADMPVVNCDLKAVISKLKECEQVASGARDILERIREARMHITCLVTGCLDWMHNKDVIHQDVKPENFLVRFNNPALSLKSLKLTPNEFLNECMKLHIWIADFGLAVRWMPENPPQMYRNSDFFTSWYRPFERFCFAPVKYNSYKESLDPENANDVLGSRYKSDIYALGNTFLSIWGLDVRMHEVLYGTQITNGTHAYYTGLLSDQYIAKMATSIDKMDGKEIFPSRIEKYMSIQVLGSDHIRKNDKGEIYSQRPVEKEYNLVASMLATDPTERPNTGQILAILDKNKNSRIDSYYEGELLPTKEPRTYRAYDLYKTVLLALREEDNEKRDNIQGFMIIEERKSLTAEQFKSITKKLQKK